MKIKELNKKIVHNCSRIGKEEYMEMLAHCYEFSRDAMQLEKCMQKWKKIYDYIDSDELMDSYTRFYRDIKKAQ